MFHTSLRALRSWLNVHMKINVAQPVNKGKCLALARYRSQQNLPWHLFEKLHCESFYCGSHTNQTSIHKDMGLIPGPAQWLRIWHCLELRCRSQTQLGSCIAMAVA